MLFIIGLFAVGYANGVGNLLFFDILANIIQYIYEYEYGYPEWDWI